MKKGVVFGIIGAILLIAVGAYFYFANPFESAIPENVPGNITGEIVLIDGFKYEPQELIISAGGTVTWINKDSVQHTVTSNEGGELNSTLLAQDEIYEYTFNQAGEYSYYCIPHPFMTGKIIVV
jgi:amicyanin